VACLSYRIGSTAMFPPVKLGTCPDCYDVWRRKPRDRPRRAAGALVPMPGGGGAAAARTEPVGGDQRPANGQGS
jgi:hypothetical protein